MNLIDSVKSWYRQLDHYLLIHYPLVWQSRIHAVLLSVLGIDLILVLLSYFVQVRPGDHVDLGEWFWIFFILSATCLVIWMIQTGRFNLFKQYGKLPPGHGYADFVLDYLCVLAIASTMLVFPYMLEKRSKNYVSIKDAIEEVNTLNLAAGWFPANLDDYSDGNFMNRNQDPTFVFTLYDYNWFDRFGYFELWDHLEGTSNYRNWGERVRELDPERNFAKARMAGLRHHEETRKLFNKPVNRKEALELIRKTLKIAEKYNLPAPEKAEYYLAQFDPAQNYLYVGSSDRSANHFITQLNYTLAGNIRHDTKPSYLMDPAVKRAIWYLTFLITLVFWIYRNVRRRDFILSLVSFVVILILSAIFIGVSGGMGKDGVRGFYLAIFILLAIGALAIFFRNSHSWMLASCLNITVVATPFIPHLIWDIQDHEVFTYELGGFLFFFALLQLPFKSLYTRLWSMPEP